MAEITSTPQFRPGGTVRHVTTVITLTGNEVATDWYVIGELPGTSMVTLVTVVWDDLGGVGFDFKIGTTDDDDAIEAAMDGSVAGAVHGAAPTTTAVPSGTNQEIRLTFDNVTGIIAGADIFVSLEVVDFMDS